MRAPNVYRLLKRLIFLLPVIWMLYIVHELVSGTRTKDEELNNLLPDLKLENVNDRQVLNPYTVYTNKQHSLNKKDVQINDMYKLPDQNLEKPMNAIKSSSKAFSQYSKDGKLSNTKGSTQQLDKLAEMGGKIVEKKPQEFFANVVFPQFNAKRNHSGPGEMGRGLKIDVNTLSEMEKSKYHKGWSANSFNQYASDLISIHRSLPDGRSQACKEQAKGYKNPLQTISVIIIFHNEAWSVLLRSVHSILTRTPLTALKEIILVDDYSTNEYLKAPLEKYFNKIPKVQIVRATKRQGLTRSRLLGYYVSSSPIVVFLDSHIECFPGWSEPLIARISEDPTRVVFPSIEVINDESLETGSNNNINQYGIFSFKDLTFQWQTISQTEMNRRKSEAEPIRSPTMPGGLFAISREFFDRLGTYDPGLDYWGGENIELSFKAWMCGGSVELVTCSHIGHIFRRTNPIHWTHNIGSKNSIRVAEVWMDDYKNYFYERILYTLGDYGNVTDRKVLREQLKCKNFQWYLQNVYQEVELTSDVKYAGEIRSASTPRCVDSMGGVEQNQPSPKLYQCHGQGQNQFWYTSTSGQIHQDQWHICVAKGQLLSQTQCHPKGPTWGYREDQTLLHIPTNLCLTASVTRDDLTLTNCTNNIYQKWVLQLRRTDLNFPL